MSHPKLFHTHTNGMNNLQHPSTEVVPKAKRRRFTSGYKLRVLKEADQATEPGAIGALLRREGIYSSSLSSWRRQRESGQLHEQTARKRGPQSCPDATLKGELAQLRREKERLEKQLRKAELIIEVQKKVSALLNLDLNEQH